MLSYNINRDRRLRCADNFFQDLVRYTAFFPSKNETCGIVDNKLNIGSDVIISEFGQVSIIYSNLRFSLSQMNLEQFFP